jgi:hypothetical protein
VVYTGGDLKNADINWKAIAIGVLLEYGLPLFLTLPIAPIAYYWWRSQGVPFDVMNSRLQENGMMSVMFVVNVGCDMLSGYVAGKIAGRRHLLHGVWVMVGSVILGIISDRASHSNVEVPYNNSFNWECASYIVGSLAILLGAHLSRGAQPSLEAKVDSGLSQDLGQGKS